MRIKNLRGVSEVRFKKTRLLHPGNVEKPPHPKFSAQRAAEGLINIHKSLIIKSQPFIFPTVIMNIFMHKKTQYNHQP